MCRFNSLKSCKETFSVPSEILRCSDKTISQALNCRIDTELARKIRAMAIKLGGSVKKEERVITI